MLIKAVQSADTTHSTQRMVVVLQCAASGSPAHSVSVAQVFWHSKSGAPEQASPIAQLSLVRHCTQSLVSVLQVLRVMRLAQSVLAMH
jgi:hypothetical protein